MQAMRIKRLSEKQRQIFRFMTSGKDALICDGAVRSGKTLAMSVAFVMWAMDSFDRANFAMCGKTVMSAERNVLKPLQEVEGLPYEMTYKISERKLTIKCGRKENTVYLFGGKDESSYTLIQGLTLAGVLFDEVALMPRSFVEQAIARTLSFKNAKVWFSCNPSTPTHWFYTEWVKGERDDLQYLHFLMRDNPILTEKEIEKAKRMYTGVFYKRYILGEWVRAEGVVFPEFANDASRWIIKRSEVPREFRTVEVGFDLGGNGSAYAMTATGRGYDGVQYRLKSEKRQAKEMAMDDIERFVNEFCESVEREFGVEVEMINSDHIQVVVNTINDRTDYRACLTYKPPLADRVFLYSRLLALDRIKFVEGHCDSLIEEMQNMVFDDKKDEAIPLDDGSYQIDAYDSACYSEAGYWHYIEV